MSLSRYYVQLCNYIIHRGFLHYAPQDIHSLLFAGFCFEFAHSNQLGKKRVERVLLLRISSTNA